MTSIRFQLVFIFLVLQQVHSEEAEPLFRAEGSNIEMGYCFGVDYIVVYRCAPEGDQLLGNSSSDSTPITLPVDLQGRIRISKNQYLLGLQISSLTHSDSGIYRRECWTNQMRVSQHTHQLSVCEEEVESEEIIVKVEDGRSELLCNSTFIGLDGTSVQWYHEVYPSYDLTLFLDSSVSLDPLREELKGVVEARDSGAVLLLDNSMLKNNHQFYCLVIKGKKCLSFQNLYLPDTSENRDIFASLGDTVLLNCTADGINQVWETPMGTINDSSTKNNQMYISSDNKSKDFSLVITDVSDEHSGDYSCMSSSFEMQYSLILCPRKDSPQRTASVGLSVSLPCDVGEDESQRVQWYRGETPHDELIYDSDDMTVPFPENLRGRLKVSDDASLLTISQLQGQDQEVYWCVVLGGPDLLLEEEDDYTDDFDDADSGDNDSGDEQNCIFKQETFLRLDMPSKPVTSNTDSNVIGYAVGGGLMGLLVVVGVVVAVIVVKRRAKAPPKQRDPASHQGLNMTRDIRMDADPGCTERLTHNDEYQA